MQAQFLIPMAISLAFGVMFATFIVLLLVPSLYFILEDIKGLVRGDREKSELEAGEMDLPDLGHSGPVA